MYTLYNLIFDFVQ